MSIRHIKEKSRRALHDFMGRAAVLYPRSSGSDYRHVTVRHHEKPGLVGDLAGTSLSYAETHDDKETVVFWCDQLPQAPSGEVELARGALVVLSSFEGYFVESVRPRYGQTITAEVTPATPEELSSRVAPEGF